MSRYVQYSIIKKESGKKRMDYTYIWEYFVTDAHILMQLNINNTILYFHENIDINDVINKKKLLLKIRFLALCADLTC